MACRSISLGGIRFERLSHHKGGGFQSKGLAILTEADQFALLQKDEKTLPAPGLVEVALGGHAALQEIQAVHGAGRVDAGVAVHFARNAPTCVVQLGVVERRFNPVKSYNDWFCQFLLPPPSI